MPDSTSAPRILIVDDDPSALFIYKTHLTRAGFQVWSAENVAAARRVLAAEKPEAFLAVITDYWMPGGTGFDLLRHVRQIDRSLAVIIVTAEGEKEHVERSMREGAHNFLDKPVSGAVLREAAAKAVESTRRQRSVRDTVSEARALGDTQRLLLGRQMAALQGRVRLFSRPHAQAGGDFAAAYPLGPGRFVVMVSDVSGHDMRAAYHSAYLQGIARGMLDRGAGIADVFGHLNRLLLEEWNKGGAVELSLAACAVDVDLEAGTLAAINSGLPTPLLADADGWTAPFGHATSHPLGWFEEVPAPVSAGLDGGSLLFWSDGLEDASDLLGVYPLALAHRLHGAQDEAESLLKDRAADDIVAVRIALCANPDAVQASRQPLLAQVFAGSRASEIDLIQSRCERSLRLAIPSIPDDRVADILLCVREALLNALVHGCQGRADRRALLQAALEPRSRTLHVRVVDDGGGHLFDFDKHEVEAADDLIPEHRGLVLLKNLAGHLHVSARGNRLSMDFPLGST